MNFEKLQPNMRITNQRQVILEELRKVKTHPTANELYYMVRERLPRIGLGTVYRNLELLADAGVIQKINTAGSQKRFDGTPELHYHIRCEQCGRVDDIAMDCHDGLEKKAALASSYTVTSHHVEFRGICGECRAQSQ